MAHSSTGEINYYYPDKNGKLVNIKREPIETADTTGYHRATTTVNNSGNNNMVAYNQVNTSQFVRIQNSYNVQADDGSTYTIISTPDNSGGQLHLQQQPHQQQQQQQHIKYETVDSIPVVKEERIQAKYAPAKGKVKLHNLIGSGGIVQRKRKPEKAGKGLRHFSMKVCEKVKEKGATTYNEVADELVNEEMETNSHDAGNCDQKNIRRRVYDALNVLMAMQIISKDKKEIRWIGLPSNSLEQSSALEKENIERRARIDQKHMQLRELILQQVALKSLIERNKEAERQGNIPTANSSIQLPFIIVNTHKTTKINCSVTNDKSEYIFKFDDKFEMHDDAEVLKRMGLLCGLDKGRCSSQDIERAKSLVPPNFAKYVVAYGHGEGADVETAVEKDDDDDMPTYIEINDSQGYSRDGMKSPDLDDDEYRNNSDID